MKRTLLFILFLLIIIPVVIYSFFKRTDAPILHGEIDLNLAYKDDLKLDIYEPTKDVFTKRPVLIYYHGGAWVGGNKITVNNNRFHEAFNILRENGYAIISPEYTLASFKISPFPNCIADAFDVISWVEKNASTYNFDLDNIGVIGESAGGHLALMTAYASIEKFTESNNVTLNYVVGIYPPSDLNKLYVDLKGIRNRIKVSTAGMPNSMQAYFDINQYLFGFDSEKDAEKANEFAKQYSPTSYINKEIPNTLIIHGNEDRIVPISQSIELKEKMDSMNINCEFHILDGVDHAFMNATNQQKEQTQKWIIDFVSEQYVD